MFLTKKAQNAYKKPLNTKIFFSKNTNVSLIKEPTVISNEGFVQTDEISGDLEEAIVEKKEKKTRKKNNKEEE